MGADAAIEQGSVANRLGNIEKRIRSLELQNPRFQDPTQVIKEAEEESVQLFEFARKNRNLESENIQLRGEVYDLKEQVADLIRAGKKRETQIRGLEAQVKKLTRRLERKQVKKAPARSRRQR